jgi:malonyl CoA-acyl carrier protein transacylase
MSTADLVVGVDEVDADLVAAHLGDALVRPVDWPATLRRAVARTGIRDGIDAGPGATLATMAEHDPVLPVRALG